MRRGEPFPAEAPIVWRSRHQGVIRFVAVCLVLADEAEVAALFQPHGAPTSRRMGRRRGPRGRQLLEREWAGEREQAVWAGPPTVRLHPVGRSYAVLGTWLGRERRFRGWYINLEQPWARTTVGFDSRDDVLDVTVAHDLSACALKDEDELAFAVAEETLTTPDAEAIRATARLAIEDVAARRWPFDEVAWERFVPPAAGHSLRLPPGWDEP